MQAESLIISPLPDSVAGEACRYHSQLLKSFTPGSCGERHSLLRCQSTADVPRPIAQSGCSRFSTLYTVRLSSKKHSGRVAKAMALFRNTEPMILMMVLAVVAMKQMKLRLDILIITA